MGCYHPIPAHQDSRGGELRLHPPLGTANLEIPCGTCIGCRTQHALEWARRAQQEASTWEHNCFLTLTYDEKNLPHSNNLVPKHLTDFIKRLRRAADRAEPALARDRSSQIRYLASGEYGETTHRPHFHLLLFNATFTDAYRVGKDLRESPTVGKYWKKGTHRLGELTGASANYVAQYTMKKIGPADLARSPNWDRDAITGCVYDTTTGEIRQQPFLRMSRKPPIGNGWLLKYKNDLQHGYLIHDARKEKIPRALIKQLAKIDPQLAEQATFNASQHKRGHKDLNAAERIHQRYRELTAGRQL